MDQNELVGELLQGLTQDISRLQQSVNQLGRQVPPDYRASIEALTQAVEVLQKRSLATSGPSDQRAVLEQLAALEQSVRQRPEYRLSQYVRYGGYVFGLMVVLVITLTWFGLSWKRERDEYEQAYWDASWRVRYTKQANADFYNYMEGVFAKEGAAVLKWTQDQEQAAEKRELARQAAEQAKAMNAQADELEGKTKGKKKER